MLRRILKVLVAIGFWTIVVSALWVLLLRFVPPPVTWLMAERSGTWTVKGEKVPFQRDWVPLDRIARSMPLAVIASEDQRFFHHRGFEWEAMERAVRSNEKSKGRRLKGASTISQQTAKNVFCWPGRSYLRKGVEAWFTLWIELLWSKERILEVYLNVAETGRNCYGVEAVAQRCFGRSAAQLSEVQSARIAAVLPSPQRSDVCRPSGYVVRREGAILRQMRNIGDQLDPEVRAKVREKLEKEGRRKRK